jgi:hypothetical protein
LTAVSIALCLFAFVCLHDQFFAGGVGRHVRDLGSWLNRRYARH